MKTSMKEDVEMTSTWRRLLLVVEKVVTCFNCLLIIKVSKQLQMALCTRGRTSKSASCCDWAVFPLADQWEGAALSPGPEVTVAWEGQGCQTSWIQQESPQFQPHLLSPECLLKLGDLRGFAWQHMSVNWAKTACAAFDECHFSGH